MPNITQDTRLLELMTPLGPNELLIRSIQGREGISQLYSFEIECFGANDTPADFNELIGQNAWVSATVKGLQKRYFHGLIKSFTRGARSNTATAYRMEIVPSLWLLSQRTQSRIFQQMTVPDILKKVLEGLDVDYKFTGKFEPRDYCVQYRESDFAFASRLMEEEGIYYFFVHTEEGHSMIVANSPQSHDELPIESTLFFDEDRGGVDDEQVVYSWEKQQVLKSGKVTLWDHCFELPHKSLDAQEMVQEDVAVGAVSHKLKIGGNENLELYDYPGGYAQRFDGIAPGNGDRPDDLQKIYEDNARTAKIRMQQETVGALQITGHTGYLNIVPGFKFTLDRHYSDNDIYVITSASVSIPQRGGYGGVDDQEFAPEPEITFTCIPLKLPFQPNRVTPKPTIYGTQTALVVGPAGEEIFVDKYSRVKVQFFWDREGKFDGSSSCWIRVASPWAGKQWGMIHIPRIGQEVVVAFEEGDPDQPIIVGSVYNADQMPPHELPANRTQSGIKSRSTPGAGPQNLNEIRFEDKIGEEFIFIHSEKDTHFRCKASYFGDVGGDYNLTVHNETKYEHFAKVSRTVHADKTQQIDGRYAVVSDGDMFIKSKSAVGMKGKSVRVDSETKLSAIGASDIVVDSGNTLKLTGSTAVFLECGGSSILLSKSGVYITGSVVHINSMKGMGVAEVAPKPTGAAPAAPALPMKPGETKATANPAGGGGGAGSSSEKKHNPNDEENKDKTHWIEVELKDESGAPVVGEACEITLPNGKIASGSTNEKGIVRVDKIDPGDCTIRWINLDQEAVSQ